MKILIMSDTHGDAEIIQTVKGYVPDAAAIVHCGDSELNYHHPYLETVKRVRGNCDRQALYPEEIVETLPTGDNLFITHGHLYNVKSTLMSLTYRAQEVGATICCFGHSHLLGVEKIGDTIFINPGSLKKPRGRVEKSFVVLTIEQNKYKIDCFDSEHNVIEQVEFIK